MQILLAALMGLILVGCAPGGIPHKNLPSHQDESTQGVSTSRIYIYRPGSFLLGAFNAQFTLDGAETANLSGGSYTYINVSEGCHHLHQFWSYFANFGKTTDLDFCTKAGENYYVRLDGWSVVSWSLTLIEKANALSEINNCRYIPTGG